MNNKFDIIKNEFQNTVLILIFENDYNKNRVSLCFNNNGFTLKYTDGEVFFENDDKDINDIIKSSKEVYIAEIDLYNGKSKGSAKHSYKVKIN